ncbi:MAG: DEAD/DEAH box helicase [Bacilli bacterium]
MGYVPTPFKVCSILDGRDVIGTAQTGTGKTAAFALLLSAI